MIKKYLGSSQQKINKDIQPNRGQYILKIPGVRGRAPRKSTNHLDLLVLVDTKCVFRSQLIKWRRVHLNGANDYQQLMKYTTITVNKTNFKSINLKQ